VRIQVVGVVFVLFVFLAFSLDAVQGGISLTKTGFEGVD
jgi:hypothetical protein